MLSEAVSVRDVHSRPVHRKVHAPVGAHTRALRQDPAAAFSRYAAKHRKVYHSDRETQARRAAFVSNLEYIVQQNGKFSQPCAPSDAPPPRSSRLRHVLIVPVVSGV